jgi:hypothetical protein
MPEKSFDMQKDVDQAAEANALGYYAFGSVDSDPRWWWTIGRFGLRDSCRSRRARQEPLIVDWGRTTGSDVR